MCNGCCRVWRKGWLAYGNGDALAGMKQGCAEAGKLSAIEGDSQVPSFAAMGRGRIKRAIVRRSTELAAQTASSFTLPGVVGPARGMSVTTRTALTGFAGS